MKGGVIEAGDDKMTLVSDLAVYGRVAGSTRAIDRYARAVAGSLDTFDKDLLEALRRAAPGVPLRLVADEADFVRRFGGLPGRVDERRAAWHYRLRGYSILARNARLPAGEATACYVLLRHVVKHRAGEYETAGLPLHELVIDAQEEELGERLVHALGRNRDVEGRRGAGAGSWPRCGRSG